MTWIKIDDSFPDHPKIIGLSAEAFRTHIRGLCYSGRFLTDGLVPASAVDSIGNPESIAELVDSCLWIRSQIEGGYWIHDYLDHQTSKSEVEEKREAVRQRVARYRASRSNAVSNANVTHTEDRIQNTEYIRQNTESKDKEHSIEELNDLMENYEINVIEATDSDSDTSTYLPALPRVKTAYNAVQRVNEKLSNARSNGINAWNLSRLIEEEWDILHNANDIGGCIGLTVWYVSELQSRSLSSSEISRIGQMTKRFGRIALMAIDEAASKDLTDLVSYAYRVAQNMYKERQGK